MAAGTAMVARTVVVTQAAPMVELDRKMEAGGAVPAMDERAAMVAAAMVATAMAAAAMVAEAMAATAAVQLAAA